MKKTLMEIWTNPARFRKLLVAVLTALVTAVSVGVLPATAAGYVAVAVAFAGAYGVYAVKNT